MDKELKELLNDVHDKFGKFLYIEDDKRYKKKDYKFKNLAQVHCEILNEILWEEDSLNLDLKNCYYSNINQEIDVVVVDDDLKSEIVTSDSEGDDRCNEGESDDNSENYTQLPSTNVQYSNSAVDNFINFTYWSVETGERVSTTTKPMFSINSGDKITLLEESEAFVANAFWGSLPRILQSTPRHLLLQTTQIASRAFFDPDYRNYLKMTYIK